MNAMTSIAAVAVVLVLVLAVGPAAFQGGVTGFFYNPVVAACALGIVAVVAFARMRQQAQPKKEGDKQP